MDDYTARQSTVIIETKESFDIQYNDMQALIDDMKF